MRRLRVLHVINRADHGGAEIYVIKVINGLLSGSIDHIVAYAAGGSILDRFRSLPIALFRMSATALNYRSPFQNFLAVVRLIRYVKKKKIDVIHAHLPEPYIWCCLVALVTGRPLVRTVVSTRRDAPAWAGPLEWFGSVVTSKIICFSKASRQEMLDIGISALKIEVIPNGIDLSSVRQVSPSRRQKVLKQVEELETPVIGTVGRMHWHKNQALMIRASAAAISQVGGTCVIDGEGPLHEELTGLATELGLGDRMVFTGWSSDIYALMSLFDVFVLSSVTEGVPNVILEAMALGVPVVATDVGGVSDLVRDGKTGLLVPSGDEKALTNSILRVLQNPEMTRSMIDRGKRLCRQRFSMASACERISRIYEEYWNPTSEHT